MDVSFASSGNTADIDHSPYHLFLQIFSFTKSTQWGIAMRCMTSIQVTALWFLARDLVLYLTALNSIQLVSVVFVLCPLKDILLVYVQQGSCLAHQSKSLLAIPVTDLDFRNLFEDWVWLSPLNQSLDLHGLQIKDAKSWLLLHWSPLPELQGTMSSDSPVWRSSQQYYGVW